MESRNHLRWTAIARVLFGVVLLGALFYYINPVSVLPFLKQIRPVWILVTSGVIVLATLLGATNLYLLFGNSRNLKFGEFLPLYWTSWAVGLVVPGQIGDLASITTLLHRKGHVWQVVLSRSLLDKLISSVVLIGIALIGIAKWVAVDILAWFILALLASGIVGGYLVIRFRKFSKHSTRLVVARALRFLDTQAQQLWECCSRFPQRVALNFFLTMVKTGLIGVSYWTVFRALGYVDIPLLQVIPLVAASSLVAYLPVSFNGIGTVEAAGLVLFSSLKIADSAVLTAYLLLRANVMLLAWLPAGLWFLRPKPANRPLR
jgi:uncharacterized membrane protein YbhN (UPF0104 family)